MFKPKSSLTTRPGAFFFWKSDDFVVVTKWGNAHGAKGITKFEPQTTNPPQTKDAEPKVGGHQ